MTGKATALWLAAFVALAGCKPPPSDERLARDAPETETRFASDPVSSPATDDAIWANSSEQEGRIVYGVPGEPALMALSCDEEAGALAITRFSKADEGAGAMLALVGNGHIGRLPVDATEIEGRTIWRGKHDASSEEWEPLAGPRKLTATLPGAGMVDLNPSEVPMELIERCRSSAS